MKRMGRRERKRRVFALIISAVVLCFLAAGCSLPQSGDSEASGGSNSSETVQEKNAGQVQRTVFAMNTMMNLRAFGENAEAAIEAAEEEIRHLDTLLQRGEESSEIYQLNSSGSREVSEETLSVIKRALEIAEATDGAFDPSIAPAADLWGFYGQNFRVPSPDEISSVLPTIGWKKISIEGNRVTLAAGDKNRLGRNRQRLSFWKIDGDLSGSRRGNRNRLSRGKRTDSRRENRWKHLEGGAAGSGRP